jgi:hypothetical protein
MHIRTRIREDCRSLTVDKKRSFFLIHIYKITRLPFSRHEIVRGSGSTTSFILKLGTVRR